MRAGLRDGLGKGANERRMSANFATLRTKLGVSNDGKGSAGSNLFRDVVASSRAQVNPDDTSPQGCAKLAWETSPGAPPAQSPLKRREAQGRSEV